MKKVKLSLFFFAVLVLFTAVYRAAKIGSHQFEASTIVRWEDKDGICYTSGGDRISCIAKERKK
jgi:hypothetical protein